MSNESVTFREVYQIMAELRNEQRAEREEFKKYIETVMKPTVDDVVVLKRIVQGDGDNGLIGKVQTLTTAMNIVIYIGGPLLAAIILSLISFGIGLITGQFKIVPGA